MPHYSVPGCTRALTIFSVEQGLSSWPGGMMGPPVPSFRVSEQSIMCVHILIALSPNYVHILHLGWVYSGILALRACLRCMSFARQVTSASAGSFSHRDL